MEMHNLNDVKNNQIVRISVLGVMKSQIAGSIMG
jgi:hypothetical protein